MNVKKFTVSILILLSSMASEIYATHIVGGTLDYIRLGPGSLPNSSRYKVKLKVYRNDSAGSVALQTRAIIYVRGDARSPFNPAISPNLTELNNRYNDPNIFVRDFTIWSGSFLDTLTVRNGAITDQPITNNTFFNTAGWGSLGDYARLPHSTINGVSTTLGFPGYEYSAFTANGMTYPAAQFMADRSPGVSGYGFLRTYKVVDNSSLIDSCTSVVQNSIEIYEFTRVVDLPNIPGGYHMYFETNARSFNVRNITNPGGTGFALYTRIPDYAALDPDPDSYSKLYDAYANLPGSSSLPGQGTVLGLGNAFTFAGLNGGYLNDLVKNNSITGIVKMMSNSSPSFLNRPPSFICNTTQNLINQQKNQNKPGNFFSAIDYDGDSLLYELVGANTVLTSGNLNDRPFTGVWRGSTATVNGTVFIGSTVSGTRLYPTMPYTNLAYPLNANIATFKQVNYTTFTGSGSISAQYPLGLIGTIPGLVIDSKTGFTSFNPPVSARMVASIQVREFRMIDDGTGILKKAFLGQIATDYQFVVRSCPLPSLAYIAPMIGCFKPKVSAVPLQFAPLDPSKDATSSWFWDTGIDRYTVSGVNSPVLGAGTSKIERINPAGSIVTNSTIGGISSPAFYKVGKNATYSFPGVGSYFVKLVVQLNSNGIGRTNCSDSVFTTVHISELRSGFTVTGSPICKGTPVTFNPFATGLVGSLTGFVTTSGASLYTSLATNPIPQVVKKRLDFAGNLLYTFVGTAQWMQPNGTRDTIAPDPSIIAPSKILYVKYAFGDGTTQEFTRTMATNSWTSIPAVNIPGSKTTVTGFYGPQSIPGVSYAYSTEGTNIKPYLLVRNQFGCQDSIFRNVTVIGATPTAQIITKSICQNNNFATIEGFLTQIDKGIWSGNQGVFFPSSAATVTGVSTVLGVGVNSIQGFYLKSIYIPSSSELAIVGLNIPLVLSTFKVPECPSATSTEAGIEVTAKPFVDAGPPKLAHCKNNLRFDLNATISGASTTGLWTANSSLGVFASTGTNSSTLLNDKFIFANSTITDVVLTLTATNIGNCNPVRDLITLSSDLVTPIPTITGLSDFETCNTTARIQLLADPSGGTWSGNGVVNSSFVPTIAGVGLHSLVYNVTINECAAIPDTVQATVISCEVATTPSPTIIGNSTIIGLTTITSTINIVDGNTITGITTFIGSNSGITQTIVGVATTIFGTNTGIDDELSNNQIWNVYPNPSNGDFIIAIENLTSGNLKWNVEVYGTTGKLVARLGVGSHTLSKGLYLLRNGKVMKKLLIE